LVGVLPYWAASSVVALLKAQHGHKQTHKNVRRNLRLKRRDSVLSASRPDLVSLRSKQAQTGVSQALVTP
jgi:hypothetical protein